MNTNPDADAIRRLCEQFKKPEMADGLIAAGKTRRSAGFAILDAIAEEQSELGEVGVRRPGDTRGLELSSAIMAQLFILRAKQCARAGQ